MRPFHRRLPLPGIASALATLMGSLSLGAQAPRPTPAEYRADVGQLRQLLAEVEKSWTPATLSLAMARLDSLDRMADTVSPVAFELAVARIVATADNGHTSVAPARRAGRFNRIGLRFTPLAGDFVVMRARPAHEDLLGARVVAIDGASIDAVRAASHTLNGGTPAWRDRYVPFLIESPEQLHALGLTRAPDAATWRFELPSGVTVERRIAGEPADSMMLRQGSQRWFFGEPMSADSTPWRMLRRPAQLPWALQDPGVPFRLRIAQDIDAVVVELRQNRNAPTMPIGRFLDSARAVIETRKPMNVVLDMRFNGGGDLNTTRAFAQELPRLVTGRIFVLTSPYTFSAAISTVGYLEQAAPERVTIVGEEVGDRLEMWAEGGPIELRHSRILVGAARERHDYVTGCRPYRDCHGSVKRNPISVPTLAPDIAAPWTRAAYMAGRDPAMDAVTAQLVPAPALRR